MCGTFPLEMLRVFRVEMNAVTLAVTQNTVTYLTSIVCDFFTVGRIQKQKKKQESLKVGILQALIITNATKILFTLVS